MTDATWLPRVRVLGRIAVGLSLLWIVGLLLVFALRVGFALELEWMEGGILHQARRFMHGEPIYPPPSEDFVPFLYTPLYAITLGMLGHVFGLGLALGRVVSIVSWVAIGLAVHRAVHREGKPSVHAIVAVGLWCAGYVFAFRWVDLARPDSMFLALALWALVLLRESAGDTRKALVAGGLMALAFWTKQTAAVLIVASGVAGLVVAPRQVWLYAAVIAVVDGGGLWWFDARTDGQLWRYVFELHQAHAFNHERFWQKTWAMFVHAAPWITLLLLWWLARGVARWRSRSGERSPRAWLAANRGLLYWSVIAGAGALVSALGYSTQWAEPNAFLPGVCFAALWVGVALPCGGRDEAVALALVAAQLLFALVIEPMYQPIQSRGLAGLSQSYTWQRLDRTIPDAAARARAAALRDDLVGQPRAVLALHRPWWSILAGGDGHVGSMGLADVPAEDRKRIEHALGAKLRARAYDELWFEGEPPAWLRASLRGRYHVVERRQGEARVRPMSGWMSEAGVVTAYTADQVRMAPVAARAVPEGFTVLADFEDGTLQGVRTHGGFGRRPVTGFPGDLPQPAGVGGAYWLSSAGAPGRVEERGDAKLGPIAVRPGNTLQVHAGAIGHRERLQVAIVDDADAPLAVLELGPGNAVLSPLVWTATTSASVFVRVRDDDPAGAIVFDDVWMR